MDAVRLVVDSKAELGEGPIWHYDKKVLYWLDILSKEIHIFSPEENKDRVIKMDQMVGTIVPAKNNRMVLAMENGFYFLDDENEQISFIADPESNIPGNRFNDGKCDPAGRFWAGTIGRNFENNVASLYCLDTDLNVTKKIDKVSISNGIVWSIDNKKMYYIDTPTSEVHEFDYDVKTGEISNRRTSVTIPSGEGLPDGMTIDSEGMIWVAHWDGWKVSRWNPKTGVRLDEVKLPVAQVTACAFGGENLNELYITTARTGLNEKDLEKQPHAGGLFVVKTDVKGIPANIFEG